MELAESGIVDRVNCRIIGLYKATEIFSKFIRLVSAGRRIHPSKSQLKKSQVIFACSWVAAGRPFGCWNRYIGSRQVSGSATYLSLDSRRLAAGRPFGCWNRYVGSRPVSGSATNLSLDSSESMHPSDWNMNIAVWNSVDIVSECGTLPWC